MTSDTLSFRFGQSETSPFDSIRRSTGGEEWWSARDLMPMLGYSEWRKFEGSIERAKESAVRVGANVDAAFAQVAQLVGAGNLGRVERADYRLTRYACYLVAMNGDPRKPEIAAAQTYFAVKTREAEVAPAFNPATLSKLDILRMAIESEEGRLQLAARVEQDAPKVQAYDTFMTAEGDYTVATAAQILGLGQNRLYALLRDDGVLFAEGKRRNTPYQKYAHHFRVVTRTFTDEAGDHASYTTFVKPSGVAWLCKFLRNKQSEAA